jgi:hypothetical protein
MTTYFAASLILDTSNCEATSLKMALSTAAVGVGLGAGAGVAVGGGGGRVGSTVTGSCSAGDGVGGGAIIAATPAAERAAGQAGAGAA